MAGAARTWRVVGASAWLSLTCIASAGAAGSGDRAPRASAPVAPAPAPATGARAEGMARVGPGVLRPFYPRPDEDRVPVRAFLLDRRPVTNGAFLRFVQRQPQWRRDRVAGVLAGADYLGHWQAPDRLGPAASPQQPVTRVTWFAARAFCRDRGARLPTEDEWEIAARASATAADASGDPAFAAQLLRWYERPAGAPLPDVGHGEPNLWGIQDLHGLVWEWVLDFQATLLATDNRTGKQDDRLRFCGAGATARDPGDYAGYMRHAFRGSLRAGYAGRALGFRCAMDVQEDR